jgi:hypothetical protein
VYLQWISHTPEGTRVVRSVRVELPSGAWSVGIAGRSWGKPPTIRLHASQTYIRENAGFIIKPGALGEYRLRKVAWRPSR